jgi:hypothetical protein
MRGLKTLGGFKGALKANVPVAHGHFERLLGCLLSEEKEVHKEGAEGEGSNSSAASSSTAIVF